MLHSKKKLNKMKLYICGIFKIILLAYGYASYYVKRREKTAVKIFNFIFSEFLKDKQSCKISNKIKN